MYQLKYFKRRNPEFVVGFVNYNNLNNIKNYIYRYEQHIVMNFENKNGQYGSSVCWSLLSRCSYSCAEHILS